MRVELVAATNPDSRVLGDVPVVLGQNPEQDFPVSAAVPGSYHCLISRVDDQLVVWDLGPNGGTLVNGAPVSKAALRAGDTVRLGGTDFAVRNEQRDPRRYLFGVRS
jgi:pSer/pThr/pTyr-binding forkhead associated (FHA) protein